MNTDNNEHLNIIYNSLALAIQQVITKTGIPHYVIAPQESMQSFSILNNKAYTPNLSLNAMYNTQNLLTSIYASQKGNGADKEFNPRIELADDDSWENVEQKLVLFISDIANFKRISAEDVWNNLSQEISTRTNSSTTPSTFSLGNYPKSQA